MYNTLQPILIPARAGGIIPLRIIDTVPILSVWVELCQTLNSVRKRLAPMALAADGSCEVVIPASFSGNRYGQKWLAVVCIQTATTAADDLEALPVVFGLSGMYVPSEYILSRQPDNHIDITVRRVVVPADVTGGLSLVANGPISLGHLVRRTPTGAAAYDAGVAAHAYALAGISISSALAGESIAVQPSGLVMIPGWGLSPGAVYYAGPGGGLVLSPAAGSAFVQTIGQAIDANRFQLEPDEPLFF